MVKIFFIVFFAFVELFPLNEAFVGHNELCDGDMISASFLGEHKFCEYVQKHDKQYDSLSEALRRSEILLNNTMISKKLSAADETATYSAFHSPYGDLTVEEFKVKVLFSGTKQESSIDILKLNSFLQYKSPTRLSNPFTAFSDEDGMIFDWVKEGKLTEIKNQGSLGTCWAFSAVTVVESQVAIKQNTLQNLSVEQLVECAADSNAGTQEADCAEFGGWPYLGFKYITEFGGIYKESDFPYCSGTVSPLTSEPDCYPCMPKAYDKQSCGDHSDLYCDRSTTLGQGEGKLCSSPNNKELVKIKDWRQLSENEDDLAEVLTKEGPISVAMSATILQFYFGGIISFPICSSEESSLDHAVVLVGLGETTTIFGNSLPFWKVRNSWGPSWGEEGYFRLKRGSGMCGINLRASIAHV